MELVEARSFEAGAWRRIMGKKVNLEHALESEGKIAKNARTAMGIQCDDTIMEIIYEWWIAAKPATICEDMSYDEYRRFREKLSNAVIAEANASNLSSDEFASQPSSSNRAIKTDWKMDSSGSNHNNSMDFSQFCRICFEVSSLLYLILTTLINTRIIVFFS